MSNSDSHNLASDYPTNNLNLTSSLDNSLSQINQKLENLEGKINQSKASSSSVQPVQVKGLGGFLWAYILFGLPSFLASILGVLILFSLLLGIGNISKKVENSVADSSSEAKMENLKVSQKVGNPSGQDGILVYELSGPIASGGKDLPGGTQVGVWTDLVAQDFELIKQNNNIKNVVFMMDTPGGEVFASEIIGDLIGDLLKNKNQQQGVFYFDQVVASGGLWSAYKNPNYVVASPYGETGSIGVRTSLPNFEKLANNIGYKELVIQSGANKDYGNPLREPLPEEVSFIQKQVDQTYNKFVQIVATGRNLDANRVKEFANGFVYENSVAKNYGLIDELGGINLAFNKAADNVKLGSNYNIWELDKPVNPLQEIFGGLGATSFDNLTKKIEAKITLKDGVMYAIDEKRLN